jgi:voltage-gated potassium channel
LRKVTSKHFYIINNLLASRYRSLLISLIAMVIVPSFFEGNKYHGLVSFLLNSLTLFLSINAIQESRKQLYLGATSAFIVVMINRFGVFREEAALDFYLSFFIYLVFYAYVAFRLLKMIVATVNVKVGVLYASVIVYILIGIVGGYILMLIENIAPGSINNLELENITTPSKFFYFSFITLSTLGYGDITPISPPARSVCIILSTTGPLYLTVLVALLVSRFEHSDIH